jgi:hypothetical protein
MTTPTNGGCMKPNIYLIKSTLVGALGGVLFGFDTAGDTSQNGNLCTLTAAFDRSGFQVLASNLPITRLCRHSAQITSGLPVIQAQSPEAPIDREGGHFYAAVATA